MRRDRILTPGDALRRAYYEYHALFPSLAQAGFTIKVPPFYDFSHWTVVSDWDAIHPRPLLLATKATESTDYRDPTFHDYFANCTNILGCRRAAFHFFRKATNPVQQADWFIDYISPSITNKDILVLDFEEGGETASQLWAFLDRVQQRRPTNQLMIYSRKNLMDPISMTEAEKTFFKKIPSWPAGYPNDPDAYSTTPNFYIPDQAKWGPVWAWQYSSSGSLPGVDSEVDCNLMEPALIDWLGEDIPMPPVYRYKATAIWNGTRIRLDHNTASAYVNSFPSGTVFEGDELFTATQQLSNTSGVYQKIGDQWLHIKAINGKPPTNLSGSPMTSDVWVAIIHLGSPICNLVDNGPTLPPVEPTAPKEVIITDPDGVRWRVTSMEKII